MKFCENLQFPIFVILVVENSYNFFENYKIVDETFLADVFVTIFKIVSLVEVAAKFYRHLQKLPANFL